MRRRRILKMLGTSAPSLILVSSTAAANEAGAQPIQGELPNENAPHELVHASPEEDATREVGKFLQLRNGWILDCDRGEQKEFFNSTRQTFVYDGQTFVLNSFDDWRPYEVEPDRFVFVHTDSPKPKGKTFQVTWDTIYTTDFDNPCVDQSYKEGDRQTAFPFESSYEIVGKDDK